MIGERLRRAAADRYRVAVAGVTALVAGFLLVRLHAWPPHEDETLVHFISIQPLADVFGTVVGDRGGAPLHFLLSHLVASIAPGLTGLRLISVAFAVASIPAAAALVARLTDRRTALVATVIVAASWATLFHGIYARMYSLFLFTSILSFLALVHAVGTRDPRRWALWGLAAVAMLATQPYGGLVLAAQAGFVLLRRTAVRFPLLPAAAAFAAVLVVATPLWLTYSLLADRFDVSFTGATGSKLGSPVGVLAYLGEVAGDFAAGWWPALALVLLLAGIGLARLARRRSAAAVLALLVVAVPALVLTLTRSGASVSLETRHLIFALPFFALLVAAGLAQVAAAAGRWRGVALALGLATIVALQVAWGFAKTPSLYAGEAAERRSARDDAGDWLAATSRPDDVLFGYEPLYLDAWDKGAPLGGLFVPRADARLAVETLEEAAEPLGRGVWVLDASDHLDPSLQRFTIPERSPGDDFEARAYGPFLVLRTKRPVGTPERFFLKTARVQWLGVDLGIGDAGLNRHTAERALTLLAG